MRGFLAVSLLLLVAALGARAEDAPAKPLWKAGQRNTIGSGDYVGHGGYLQYGDAWRLKGSYSDYRFDGSTGTTRTFGARGSYQDDNFAAGLSVSVTPRNDSYANRSFGLDGAWTFVFDDDKGDDDGGLQDLEVGAWWTQTRHSQIVPSTPALPLERNVVINQHDLGVNAALTAWDFTASVDASRSVYDQPLIVLPVRLRPRLAETASLVNSFPAKNASARLEYSGWRPCTPYASASATRYEIQPQPTSATYGAGAALKWDSVTVDLGYELTRQKGSEDTKYFNFGGSFKF